MGRTVTALYDTRAEAETAKARLQAEAGAENSRILAKDTIAALDTLKIAPSDSAHYREEVQRGGHLLVAEVPDGKDAERIIRLLQQATMRSESSSPGARSASSTLEEVRIPQVEEQIRVGKQQVERGGARVRSFIREKAAEESIALRDERVIVETRPVERRLTDTDVQSAGLLKERIIEVSEMREEPVVTKSAVLREEVILKKEITERVETVRDSVRQTEVEIEELAPSSGLGSAHGDRERSSR
jgi:uncharacterized protein (TIGR02271 family)